MVSFTPIWVCLCFFVFWYLICYNVFCRQLITMGLCRRRLASSWVFTLTVQMIKFDVTKSSYQILFVSIQLIRNLRFYRHFVLSNA